MFDWSIPMLILILLCVGCVERDKIIETNDNEENYILIK